MTDSIAFSDAQIQKLLASLEALKPSNGIHWETVIPVFLSAFLAMCVGIALELYKGRRERIKAVEKKAKDELTAINVATVAMSTNLELLEHSPCDLNHFCFLGFPSGWVYGSLCVALIWEAQHVSRLFL